nr:hypothetical protein [Aeromonas caviae]
MLLPHLHARCHQGTIALIDGDVEAVATLDAIDPLGVKLVVGVGGGHDDVVEQQLVGVVGGAAQQVLEQVVAHAVQQQVDGEGAALVHLLGEVAIPGLAVVGELLLGLLFQLRHILAVEFVEQPLHLLQHPVKGPGRGQGIALVALVAQHAPGAAAIGGPAEAEHLDAIPGLEPRGPLQHIVKIVVEAVYEQQQVFAGLELLLGRAAGPGAALQQLARHIGAGRVGEVGVKADAGGHLGGDLIRQQVQLPLLALTPGLGEAQFVGALCGFVAKDLAGGLALLVDHPVGDDKHGVLLVVVLSS